MHRGELAKAEEIVQEYVRNAPQNFLSHSALGFFYVTSSQYSKAIAPLEEAVRLKPDDLVNFFNLVAACSTTGEREKCVHWARVALPYYERHLKLHPDDESKRVEHANLLLWNGRTEDAYAAAMKLTDLKDGSSIYNTACLVAELGDKGEALRIYRKAIEAGYRSIRNLKEFLTDEIEGILSLAGSPEYEEVQRMVKQIEAEATSANG
jgi:tetratricopeptide (TPR) repeat protein